MRGTATRRRRVSIGQLIPRNLELRNRNRRIDRQAFEYGGLLTVSYDTLQDSIEGGRRVRGNSIEDTLIRAIARAVSRDIEHYVINSDTAGNFVGVIVTTLVLNCDRLAGEVQTLWMLFQLTDGPRVLQNFTKSEKRWVLTNTVERRKENPELHAMRLVHGGGSSPGSAGMLVGMITMRRRDC